MPYQPIGKYEGSRGFARKMDFKRPVTFYDRVRFVGSDSTMEIFGGTLDGTDITAGTITTDRLILGSSDNLIKNPGGETGDFLGWTSNAQGGSWSVAAESPRSGKYSFRYDTTNQSAEAYLVATTDITDINAGVAAAEGDTFYMEAWVMRNGSGPYHRARLQMYWRDEDGVFISSTTGATVDPNGTYQKLTLEGVAPAGTAFVVFRCRVLDDGSASGHRIHFDDCYARRKVGTLVIDGQAVDIERMLDPVHADTIFKVQTAVTIPSSGTISVTEDFTIPSWVGELSVLVSGNIWAGTWDNTGLVTSHLTIGGTEGNSIQDTVASGEYGVLANSFARTITSPASTIEIEIEAGGGGNAQTGTYLYFSAIATGLR